MDEASAKGPGMVSAVKKLRREDELSAEERCRLEWARERTRVYRTHYECVQEYLRYCDLLVELGLKPSGYQPSVHRLQQELGIGCWRTVKRCLDRAREEKAQTQ